MRVPVSGFFLNLIFVVHLLHLPLVMYCNALSQSVDQVDFRLDCKDFSCMAILCSIISFNSSTETATLRFASYERTKNDGVSFKWPRERTVAVVESHQFSSPYNRGFVNRGIIYIPVEAHGNTHLVLETSTVRLQSQQEFAPSEINKSRKPDTRIIRWGEIDKFLVNEREYDEWTAVLVAMFQYVVREISLEWSKLKGKDVEELEEELPVRDFEGTLQVSTGSRVCRDYLMMSKRVEAVQWKYENTDQDELFARRLQADLAKVREDAFQSVAQMRNRRKNRDCKRRMRAQNVQRDPQQLHKRSNYHFTLCLLEKKKGDPIHIVLEPKRIGQARYMQNKLDWADRAESMAVPKYTFCNFPSRWYASQEIEAAVSLANLHSTSETETLAHLHQKRSHLEMTKRKRS